MTKKAATLPDDPQELRKIIAHYEQEVELLREQVRVLYARLFGKKSEKGGPDAGTQLPLFDMPEPEIEPCRDEVKVPSHSRQKSGRKKLPEILPRVVVEHDIPEEEKTCGCGHEMSRIGEEISEKLDIIPAVIQVIRHVRPKYACRHCEGLDTAGPVVKIAPTPKQIIDKGIATAGLLAHILTAKFCDGLPFYRQEGQFERLGVEIPRATMCNWAMKGAEAAAPLLDLLRREIRSGPLINIDETTVQVLQEPGRSANTKSYMWVCRGGPPGKTLLLYHYDPSRSSGVAKQLLTDYKGVVQSDGYTGYDFLDVTKDVAHAGCWAHARRKFKDADKGAGKARKAGSVDVALSYIQRIYAVEKEGAKNNLNHEQMVELRQRKTQPVLDDFFRWLSKKATQVVPKSLLGIAVNYTLNQWSRLTTYLDHGVVGPDNNAAENAIRPFVIGRKNWLFAGNPAGAVASASLYSLVESAKANGLEPYRYLRYIFEKLPFALSESDYEGLLPNRLKAADLLLPQSISGV